MGRKKNFDEAEALEEALDLFWEKGYQGTSVQDLVDRLGVNRASIYDTWGDKHSLYLKTLEKYRQSTSSWLLEQIRSDQLPFNIIKALLRNAIEQSQSDEHKKGCFLVNAATELSNCDRKVQDITVNNQKTIESVLNELIKEGQENGEITTKHSSQSLAGFIYNTIVGLQVLGKNNTPPKQMEEIVEITLSVLK